MKPKKSNLYIVLPAVILMFCVCPLLSQIDVAYGIIAFCIGLLFIAYGLFTGELKLFG